MDIKQLKYFVTVVEEGNISAAAKKLHICQPPLSHQMKTLELELGIKLMERGSRRVTLNEAGKLLYKRAKNIISLVDSAVKEIDNLKNGSTGSVSLGIASSCALSVIQEYLVQYHKEYPQVNFKFIEGQTDDVIQAVSSGVVELAVVRTPFNHDGLYNITLIDEPMVAVYDSKFSFEQDELTLEELKGAPIILYNRYADMITNSFYTLNIDPFILCSTDEVKTAISCAKSGLGIAILPSSTVAEYVNDGELQIKEISNPELKTEVKLIYSNKQFLTRLAQGLLDRIKSVNN